MTGCDVWLPVPGYAGLYEVSNLGEVRNAVTGQSLKPGTNRGYQHVSLYRDNDGGRTYYVHTLVLRAFCGEPPFPGFEACHNDGDRGNNRLTNLRWGSRQDNVDDRVRHGRQQRGTRCRTTRLTEDQVRAMRAACRAGQSTRSLAREYGISTGTAWSAIVGATWKHIEGAVNNVG